MVVTSRGRGHLCAWLLLCLPTMPHLPPPFPLSPPPPLRTAAFKAVCPWSCPAGTGSSPRRRRSPRSRGATAGNDLGRFSQRVSAAAAAVPTSTTGSASTGVVGSGSGSGLTFGSGSGSDSDARFLFSVSEARFLSSGSGALFLGLRRGRGGGVCITKRKGQVLYGKAPRRRRIFCRALVPVPVPVPARHCDDNTRLGGLGHAPGV